MEVDRLKWIIKDRVLQAKKIAAITNPEEKRRAQQRYWNKANTRRFYYVDRCRAYVDSLTGNPERCINYTLYYNGRFWVKLDWAVSINLPNRLYWHDCGREFIELVPFGVNWVMDYLLHKHSVLVIRKSTLADLSGLPVIDRIK